MARKKAETPSLDEKIFAEIQRLELSPVEARKVIKQLQGTDPRKYHGKKIKGDGKHSRFGVISDGIWVI